MDDGGNSFLYSVRKPEPQSPWEIFHQPSNGAVKTVRPVSHLLQNTMFLMLGLYGRSNDTDNESRFQNIFF